MTGNSVGRAVLPALAVLKHRSLSAGGNASDLVRPNRNVCAKGDDRIQQGQQGNEQGGIWSITAEQKAFYTDFTVKMLIDFLQG